MKSWKVLAQIATGVGFILVYGIADGLKDWVDGKINQPDPPAEGRLPVTDSECLACGKVELRLTDIVKVLICSNNEQGSMMFTCPSCGLLTEVLKSSEQVKRLVELDCDLDVWRLPLEFSETHPADPFASDVVRDFHLQLQADDQIEEEIQRIKNDAK